MSKSSIQTSKPPLQLQSGKGAWAKGPPAPSAPSPRTATTPTTASPRAASPALPNASATPPASVNHSRRSSMLGQGVPIKDGVSVAQRNAGTVKQGSAVTFGSINDTSAPVSSSPANVPTLKPQATKSFGSIVASNGQSHGRTTSISAKPPTPTTTAATTPPVTISAQAATSASSAPAAKPPAAKMSKADIAKMFQSRTAPAAATTSSSPAPATASSTTPSTEQPTAAPAKVTPTATPVGTSSTPLGQSYTPFVPSATFRGISTPAPVSVPPAAPPSAPVNGSVSPRTGQYPQRPMNGTSPRPNHSQLAAPGTPQLAAANVAQNSPRMSPMHPHAPPPGGMPPPQMAPGMAPGMPPQGMPWPGYYYTPYPGMPPPDQYMQYGQHQYYQGMPHPMHQPPPPGQPGMSPLSPRGGVPLPGTPSQHQNQLPPNGQAPPGGPPAPGAIPPTPSTPSSLRMNTSAPAFVPGGTPARKSLIIRDAAGNPIDVAAITKSATPASPVVSTPVREKRTSIRIESQEAKAAREKREKEEKEAKEKAEREAKEKVEREAKEKAEAEKREKEEAERKVKEEEERKVREEEERKEAERKKAEEEARAKEEAARKAKEEEERKVAEAARLKAEEEAKRKAEEEEAERKKVEEDAARVKAENEEKERLRKEEEEEKAANAAAETKAAEAKPAAEAASDDKEEGEIDDSPAPLATEKPKLSLATDALRKRPGPLDLSGTQKGIAGPLPSALATARIIEDINQVAYPSGIMSPKLELNVNAKQGKFRYDRDFLLQFMSVCKEKPDQLPPLDAIGLEPADQTHMMSRGGSGRRASNASPMVRQNSIGLGINTLGKSGFSMGNFGTPTSKQGSTSEQRFMASQGPGTPTSALAGGRGGPMGRTSSSSGRTRGTRGPNGDSNNNKNNKGGRNDKGSGFAPPPQMLVGPDGLPLGPVKPLEKSQDAWAPVSQQRKGNEDSDDPALVERKVKMLLNKLTMEKFDSISDQIITWANKSEQQTDGRTLIQVIKLVFEKATDEAAWSEMYARLCRKMMEQISSDITDESIKNPEGKPITGGQLFRKYLLNRCQEDFERGWASKEAAAAAAAAKAQDDAALQASNTDKKEEEIELYSDEYYASQKAKRQGLGLVKFIGELFKLQMLTERIMHECVKKLLNNVENPEEEEIESLCKLLTTVGKLLDTQRGGPYMDIYFTRMRELTKNPKVNSRMNFMLLEILELRDRKWVPRNQTAAPATISQIREDAARESLRAQNERTMSMSRGGSRRGQDRNAEGPDGWTVTGNAAPRPTPRAGDLSNFGKINKPATGSPMTFGPSSVFNKKGSEGGNKRDSASLSRASSINAFSLLSQNPEIAAEVANPSSGKSSRAPSRKPSVDLGPGGAPEVAPARRKLQLLPRSKPVEDGSRPASPEGVAFPSSEDKPAAASENTMSDADAKKKIDEDIKEFFAVRNIDEGEDYFDKLPAAHKHTLVDKLVTRAIESKESDAQLVADLFARALDKDLCEMEAFEQGFMPVAEMLDDIAIDAPKAYQLMVIMLKGSGLADDDLRRGRLAEKLEDQDKLLKLLS